MTTTDNRHPTASEREITVSDIESAWRAQLPEGYSMATCPDFCGDFACGVDLHFEQCADEVLVWGDDGFSPAVLRALGHALLAITEATP